MLGSSIYHLPRSFSGDNPVTVGRCGVKKANSPSIAPQREEKGPWEGGHHQPKGQNRVPIDPGLLAVSLPAPGVKDG